MFKGALRSFKAIGNNGNQITYVRAMDGLNLSFTITDTDHTQKWHNRLAHVSVKRLKFFNDKGVFGKD